MCCEEYLQEPFVFLSCDTLVSEVIPSPNQNWIGFANIDNNSSYRTLNVHNHRVVQILEKGTSDIQSSWAYIGLAGINNYPEFWSAMHQGGRAAIEQGEAYSLRYLLERFQLNALSFTWFDTGTPRALENTRKQYIQQDEPNILEKQNEAIWFVGNRVIKFSGDKDFTNRVQRAAKLSEYTPKISNSSDHMYSYHKASGDVLSKVITLPLFKLLDRCKKFWKL